MSQIGIGPKLAYGLGSVPYAVKDAAFGTFVLLYYTQVLGLSGSLTGMAIFISVLWDAVSDPMIGAWSDRLNTRWGRRHPMLVTGAIPLGLSFVMLFHPIEAVAGTQWPLFTWLLVSVLLVRTFLTVFIIPHTAMGAELTDDYEERTSIVNFRTNLGWIAGTAVPALSLAVLFGSVDGEDGRFIAQNYHQYGWASCFVIVLAGTICVLGSRRFIPRLIEVANRGVPTPGFIGMVRDTLDTLNNLNFRRIIVLEIAVGGTMGILGALNMIAWTYFWELTVSQIAILSISSLTAVTLLFPGMRWLAMRWEKQTLLKFAVAGLVFNTLWFVPGRLLGWLPENGTSVLFALVFVQSMIGTALSILRTVNLHSIMADIADEYELATGRRQEGVFFAAAAFALKFVMGFGYMIGGPLLDFVGLKAGVAPGEASQKALLGIGIAIGPVMVLLLLIPWWMAVRIDVSRGKLARVHSELGVGPAAGS
ncbi:MAG: MFS transporter [Pseudomonadales bacterium]|jgi:Na+/melibiose symporter-like transporter|nr:MFS transporter [Pseudomonadales bacterium]MDP6472210.1 MFS transporter [Pseudomonadales bacterium]MDP6826538.1 MFS transporter [Pseudomonadales bacterium]MDP6970346.1 MFS transporter [Pseudomonadales bacterium]|tara:strand:- start:3611 stop:5044 length:1434 start_codon:yes stop_codon:yes gene_type:complete